MSVSDMIAGKEFEICFRPKGDMDVDVLFGVTRLLGSFFAEFEHDPYQQTSRLTGCIIRAVVQLCLLRCMLLTSRYYVFH